jgi:hypothetical protein
MKNFPDQRYAYCEIAGREILVLYRCHATKKTYNFAYQRASGIAFHPYKPKSNELRHFRKDDINFAMACCALVLFVAAVIVWI